MKPTIDMYPVFEANQVLTNNHLNQVFNYLDEQERLSRANLIGIGIVCGLDITINGSTSIRLSKGCGVTSEGYLVVEPEDVELVAYRADYTVPLEVSYPPFRAGGTQYPLWELFPVGEPNTQPLAGTPNFLNDKVVLLFLELRKDDLSNCSPNNCDDKGAEVTATVRRLLMRTQDATAMVAAANALGEGLTQTDLTLAMQARLNLPDLRLPRYDVPATVPATSVNVLSGFMQVFEQSGLVTDTRAALYAAYQAFRPLLAEAHPSNPFTGFSSRYQFLQNGLGTQAQARFLQYYYDLFDDIIKAYDEFRWKGIDVLCACCPSAELFPRHLILGQQHRQVFLPSAAIGRCEELTAELNTLFEKLVLMVTRFTNAPELPQQSGKAVTDAQIRITPSLLSDAALSTKAIPYYYDYDGQPPIRDVWNPALTRRQRTNQNQSYWASHYSPAAPAFVRNALGYDLEPYNFLRVEGHIGKDYKRVLATLLSLRNKNRLPIDVIALRTGEFDENMEIDLRKENCRFRDLETLYDALRDELLCSLRKTVRNFSARPLQRATSPAAGATAGTVGATEAAKRTAREAAVEAEGKKAASEQVKTGSVVSGRIVREPADEFKDVFIVETGTYGAFVEQLIREQGLSNVNAVAERPIVNAVVNSMALLFRFSLLLQDDLFEVDWEQFDALYAVLQRWSGDVTTRRNQTDGDADLSWRDLDTELVSVVFACRLAAFKSLREEYAARVREVKQKQYFAHFVSRNPGIQHKAGVPMGGTFIIVYHQADEAAAATAPGTAPGSATSTRFTADEVDALVKVIGRKEKEVSEDKEVRELLAGIKRLRQLNPNAFEREEAADNRILETFAADLEDGTVIADFFVPYLCCSDCMPIQYLIPREKPEAPEQPLEFTVRRGCTTVQNTAEVTVTATGGVPPYQVIVNAQAAAPLTGPLALPAGVNSIVVLDAAGNRTQPVSETVPPPLSTGQLRFEDDSAKQVYDASFRISGGTAPYTTSKGTITGDTCTIPGIKSAEVVPVQITDARGCTTALTIQHTVDKGCNKPCDGRAERCRYMAWQARPVEKETFVYRSAKSDDLIVVDEGGKQHPIAGVPAIVQNIFAPEMPIDARNYDELMMKMVEQINAAINKVLDADVFVLGYSPNEGGLITFEKYVCHTFTWQIQFSVLSNDVVREEVWAYSEGGVDITQTKPGVEAQRVAKFGCVQLDKCAGTSGAQPVRSSVELSVEDATAGKVLTPKLTPAMNESAARAAWRIDGTTTVISKELAAKVTSKLPVPFKARLVVNTKDGGWAYLEQNIDKPQGTVRGTTGGITGGGITGGTVGGGVIPVRRPQ